MTLRLLGKLPNLRGKRSYRAVQDALEAARERFGMRLVHWSVQGNHLHLIVEAKDKLALSKGLQGLKIRVAKGLNRLWRRKGTVFSDRYHAVALRTPRQVRSALLYVLNNFRKHERQRGRRLAPSFVDPLSTALAFDGWKRRRPVPSIWKTKPRSWLLAKGWRKWGLIPEAAVPGP